MGSLKDVEAAIEEVPLMTNATAGSGSSAEPGANSSGEIPTSSGTCRICLETSSLEELEEACSCKGSMQLVHHACLQRWIDERDLPRNSAGQALVCELCKQPYKDGFRPPPPRPSVPSRRVERVMIGQDLYVIVVDSESGERVGTARPMRGFNDYEDDDEDYPARHLNPVSACVFSFFLFMMSSILLSHLFTSLPGTSTGDPDGSGSSKPSPMDDEQADEQFQDLSMTLLLLWLMLRLLVIVAPVYTISRMFERARLARTSADSSSENDGVELGVVDVEAGQPAAAGREPVATS